MAIVVDLSIPYYWLSYNLEGDGPLAPFAYDEIMKTYNFLNAHTLESYPKVKEVIESLSFMSRILNHQEREVNKTYGMTMILKE